MAALPEDVAASVARGVGLFVRSVPVAECPKNLRRYRSFRPSTMARHRDRLLEAIENEDVRAQILEWLDESRPRLDKGDAVNLRLALERPEGWEATLAGRSRTEEQDEAVEAAPAGLEQRVAAERARARRAREDLKSARREMRSAIEAAEARAAELAAELERLSIDATAARADAATARRDAEAARSELERERRKARREAEKATTARDEARSELKQVRRTAAAANREAARLQQRVDALEAAARSTTRRRSPGRDQLPRGRARRPLPVPKGRPGDDPQTLDEWLAMPRVKLLVDGYNVTKAQGGFGDLELEDQRQRLIQEVGVLVAGRSVPATVIFDGSHAPPGTGRRMRGPVAVEYSRPDETADDHLIALLEKLPPDPVVVTTNDRELQARAAALGATIASSDQLLGLIR